MPTGQTMSLNDYKGMPPAPSARVFVQFLFARAFSQRPPQSGFTRGRSNDLRLHAVRNTWIVSATRARAVYADLKYCRF